MSKMMYNIRQSLTFSLKMIVVFCFSTLLFAGCVKKDDTMAQKSEEVESTNEEVTDSEMETDNPIEDDEAELVVTEVVYNYDDYESVASIDASEYKRKEPIKGIYVSAHAAGSEQWIDNLIELADTTEINAFVIDVKNDDGHVTFEVEIPEVIEVGSSRKIIRDIDGLMDKLYEHDIFPIARIVTFKDPYLAKNKQEYAIKNQDGSLWYYKNVPWLNPYNKDTWDYVLDVAKEAVNVGFKEIQFDYIRFEATTKLNDANFGGLDTISRREIILEFVDYATAELHPLGVDVTADVFGIVINSERDAKVIGQNYVEMSKRLDAICPMVYPSHYGYGFYGTPKGQHSDLYPYRIIYGSMEDSNEELAVIPEGEHVATVRPWLQAFTASYLGSGNYKVYDRQAIRDQVQAVYDAGLDEWILWNAGTKYNSSALLSKEEAAVEREALLEKRKTEAEERAKADEEAETSEPSSSEEVNE